MTLQFQPYGEIYQGMRMEQDQRRGGLDRLNQTLQLLNSQALQSMSDRKAQERQAVMDRILQDDQRMKRQAYNYEYRDPLMTPNPTVTDVPQQPSYGQRQPVDTVSLWNQKYGAPQRPQVPQFNQLPNNADPFSQLSPEMQQYAQIPGAKNRADYANAYKLMVDSGKEQWERNFKERQLASNEGLKKELFGRNQQNQRFGNESQIRTQFLGQSKDFADTASSYQRIIDSSKNPSAAGDLALIFNYMKMLDPGSTVREGEFANAAASGSYGARFQAAAQKVMTGERLDDSMRADFLSRATDLYKGQLARHKARETEFKKIGAGYGLDPSLPDLSTPIGGYGGVSNDLSSMSDEELMAIINGDQP